jgi:multisubunit Na+/H+ antiporter MnhE subunit
VLLAQDPSKRDLAVALPSQFAEVTVGQLAQSLVVGVVLSLVLVWHHRRFASVVTSRSELRSAIPFVLLTTVLVISVVKSSLALSLGLVGALSIVRFRTPLKEPEELAYVFLALAIGLGLGAGQILITVLAAAVILAFIGFSKLRHEVPATKQIYLSLDLVGAHAGGSLGRLHDVIGRHARSCDLRRYDTRDQGLEATYALDLAGVGDVDKLASELRATFPGIGITFLDQSRLPAV